MNDFMKLNCDEFLERLASKEPVPGGGGAAALGWSHRCGVNFNGCQSYCGKRKIFIGRR